MSNQKEKTTAQAARNEPGKTVSACAVSDEQWCDKCILYPHHEFYRILCKRSVRTCAYVCNDNGNRHASF